MNDRRSVARRTRDEISQSGDLEFAAAQEITRLSGLDVTIFDDGSSNAMCDLLIGPDEKPVGFCEVTQYVSRLYMSMASRLRRHPGVPPAGSRRRWWLRVWERGRIKDLEREVPQHLADLERDGEMFTGPDRWAILDSAHPAAQRLCALGVVAAFSSHDSEELGGKITLLPTGAYGMRGDDWTGWLSTLNMALVTEDLADVRMKLAAVETSQRHLYLSLGLGSPVELLGPLSDRHDHVPPEPPQLPHEITHLWVSYQRGRTLLWDPERGWLDTRANWLTD